MPLTRLDLVEVVKLAFNHLSLYTSYLQTIAIGVPLAFIFSNYYATRDKTDLIQATLCEMQCYLATITRYV